MGRFLFSFRGRISRAQFWGFVLLCYAVGAIIGIVDLLIVILVESLVLIRECRDRQ